METNDKTTVIHTRVPQTLVDELDRVVGLGNRSEFVREAVIKTLTERVEQRLRGLQPAGTAA
jgi:metal-responsive CopG/Arc/MetJ family transcriptional regulator